ncbi:HpcH/HpaI aldolase/citrate lyase family, putative [Angomonas deanei]|uniref:HpcH/HpaI aldolase/citrate lyase family, putative n=1 Tax=Angomonas deanei TaxID=59799 RepID=A0A7G2C8G0_9TRYP|nr:HpcH/HpaI aldolase/citrate lyase family, putative [Angomonas deanei]
MSSECAQFQQDLRQGQTKYGLFLNSGSTPVCHALSYSPYDWLLVDAQHSAIDCHTVLNNITAAKANVQKHVMVRVASYNDRAGIQFALDSGADGVLIPYINHRQELEEAVSCCYYPHYVPNEGKSYHPENKTIIKGTRSFGYPVPSMSKDGSDAYVKGTVKNLLIAFQVETEDAIKNINDILTVPGVDMAFLGPFDQCLSMGIYQAHGPQEMFDTTEFQTKVVDTLSAAVAAQNKLITNEEHKILLGVFLLGNTRVSYYKSHGFRFIGLGADIEHLLTTAKQYLSGVGK